ncbi:MAG: YjbH domain-containing protein, partial [Rhodobacteraceae bacterium]
LGVQLTFALNPKEPPAYSGLDKAPPPVLPRNAATAAQLGWGSGGDWAASPAALDDIETRAARALSQTGLVLRGIALTPGAVRVEIDNPTYRAQAQAAGRAARALTGVLPPSVETITVVLVKNGIAASQMTLRRSDLEALEYDLDNSWSSFARARIGPSTATLPPRDGLFPRWEGGFAPYITPSFFDPDDPIRADLGVQYEASLELAPGWVLYGLARKKIVGNLDQSTRVSNSVLPRVRSDFNIYDREGDPALVELTLNRFFQPGEDLYGRVSVGYLETMYAGVSGELLWKPFDSDLALGVEVNWVRQRDFDQRFGLQDYSVTTGHVSAYYDFGNGFTGQMDVGRYLAGDWGATVALDRRFRNGWTVGAFATKTDVSAAEFGEGSFDKGIRLTIPLDWISGQPDRRDADVMLRPVQRDGGARVTVSNRLYGMINDSHQTGLQENWGRFWR